MFYAAHDMKHPSGLYNVSIGKVDSAVSDFIEVLLEYRDKDFDEVDKKNTGKLLKTYRTALLTFREHLDDCFSIVKIFCEPPANEKKQRNQYRWLELNVKPEIDTFLDSVNEYKNYIDLSVNELKHNNGILAGIAFYDENDGSKNCLGYFIANVIDGAYSPVDSIHPKMQDVYTAFSFRRDLHYNLFNIYKISEDIIDFLRDVKGIDVGSKDVNITPAPDSKKKLYRDIMDMQRYHFPDEYAKPVPSVSLTEDNNLKLAYPSQLSIQPNRLNRVVLTHSTDGHTRGYSIPYFGSNGT